jgi:site-specific DNA-cytosine methylase
LRTYERILERFPKLFARPPKDIFSLGEHEVRKVAEQIRARKQKWDLVMAGTDCRDFSSARGDNAPGMNGDKELFSDIQLIIQAVKEQNPNVRFLIECVAFGGLKYGGVEYTSYLSGSWQQVQDLYEEVAGSSLRHEVINMEDHFVPQRRVRLFLRNFEKREDFPVLETTFQDVLEADGETSLRAAKTIMASSTASVRKEGLNDVRVKGTGESRPLRLVEEERLQGLPDGHTELENIPLRERMKLIGNALPTPAVLFYMRAAMRPANIFKDLSEPDIELRPEDEQQFMELHALSTELPAELNALSLSTLTQRISDVCQSNSDYRDLYATVRDGGEEEKRSIVHAKADGEGGIVVSESGQWIISEGDSDLEKDLRQEILEMVHDPYHNGFATDWNYMRHHLMWSCMKKDLKRYIETCAQCNLGKNTTQTTKGKPLPLPVPDRPGQRLSMDMLSMPPEEASWGGQKRRYTGIIAWKDMFSKFCILIPYTGTLKAQEMADLYISHADQHFGDVTEIVSDRDQRYTSRVWQGIMKSKNIQQLKTTSHRPQGDGSSERLFRSVLEKLRVALVAEKEDGGGKWPELLSGVQKALNNNRHTATGHAPHFLHFGREMRSTLDLLTKPEKPIGHLEEHVREQEEKTGKAVLAAREALEKQRDLMKKRRPENARQSFAPGDAVFIKDFPAGLAKKLQPRQKGPFTILEKKNDQVYVLQRRGVREQHTFNADRLIKVTGVEEALARFPRDRWSPPDAGAPNPLLGPVEITSIDYSVIPPRYLVKSTRNGPATTHEEDELVAHYADEADTPGAIRAVIHKYLEKKNRLVLKEIEVPDPDLDPAGYKKYQDHRTLLYDRRTDALGPQYVRRSTTAGFEWELTQECVARLRFLANQEEPRASQRASREVGFQEPTAVPPDLHSAEDEQVALRRRERFREQRRKLMATPHTHFVWELPNQQEQGSDSDEDEEIRQEPGEDNPNLSASEEPGDTRARMMAEVNARGQEVLAEYLQGRDNESEGNERDPGEHIHSPVVTDADNIERVDVEGCARPLAGSDDLVEGEHFELAEVDSAENDVQRGVLSCDIRVAEEGVGGRLERPTEGLLEETEPRRSDRLAGDPPENEGLALSGPMGTLALAEVVTHPLSGV